MYGCESCLQRKLSTEELMLWNCGVGEDSWESLGLQGDPTSPSWRNSVLRVHWKDWCWSWNSNTLATWCKELTHLKRSWCWERSKAGEEGDNRGWDGWMASPTQWTWVWVNSRSWWRTGRPGVLQSTGLQRAGHDWATELSWSITLKTYFIVYFVIRIFSFMTTVSTLAQLARSGNRPCLHSNFVSSPLSVLHSTFSFIARFSV